MDKALGSYRFFPLELNLKDPHGRPAASIHQKCEFPVRFFGRAETLTGTHLAFV